MDKQSVQQALEFNVEVHPLKQEDGRGWKWMGWRQILARVDYFPLMPRFGSGKHMLIRLNHLNQR